MNSEFTAAWRGEGGRVFIVGAQRHRLVPSNRCQKLLISTGWRLQPVPITRAFSGIGLWRDPVPMSAPIAPVSSTTRCHWCIVHLVPAHGINRCLCQCISTGLCRGAPCQRSAQAKSTGYCCNRYKCFVSVPVGAVAGTFDLDLWLIF